MVCLKAGKAHTLFQSDLSDVPMFVLSGDDLWSFAPAPVLSLKLAPWLMGEVRAVERVKLEVDPKQRRFLTWLLLKHREPHLKRFRDNGLFIELKKDRAFFRKLPRKSLIEYDSAKRRGNKREVVKVRAEGRWHENEGIGYQVVYSAGRMVDPHQTILHVHRARWGDTVAGLRTRPARNAAHEMGPQQKCG